MINRKNNSSPEKYSLEIVGLSTNSLTKLNQLYYPAKHSVVTNVPSKQQRMTPNRPSTAANFMRNTEAFDQMKLSAFNAREQQSLQSSRAFLKPSESKNENGPRELQPVNYLLVPRIRPAVKIEEQLPLDHFRSVEPAERQKPRQNSKIYESSYQKKNRPTTSTGKIPFNRTPVLKPSNRDSDDKGNVKATEYNRDSMELKGSVSKTQRVKSFQRSSNVKHPTAPGVGENRFQTPILLPRQFAEGVPDQLDERNYNKSPSYCGSRPDTSQMNSPTMLPMSVQDSIDFMTLSQQGRSNPLSTNNSIALNLLMLSPEKGAIKLENTGAISARLDVLRNSKDTVRFDDEEFEQGSSISRPVGMSNSATFNLNTFQVTTRPPISPNGHLRSTFVARPMTSTGSGFTTKQKTTLDAQERDKIAQLKRKLTLTEQKAVDISRRKTKINSENLQSLKREASIQLENHSNFDVSSNDVEDDNDVDEEEDIEDPSESIKPLDRRSALLCSVYEDRPKTIFFQYPPCCERTRDTSRAIYLRPEEEKAFDLKYKSGTLLCITKTFEMAGFKRTEGSSWNSFWGKPKHDRVKEMNKYQKTNHFPGCWHLGRKDNLWRNLSRMKRQHPTEYNFVPNTFLLSSDYNRFAAIKESAENKALWIMKPCAQACGRGIKVIGKRSKVKRNVNYLVSEYISNPHLINGYKYDLRLYVLVSSFDPLRIYLHKEGLVRFATEKYSVNSKSIKERFVHLTNFSVNKNSQKFVKNQDPHEDGVGSKWSFGALKKKYEEMGINHQEVWDKIKDVIIKTLISGEPYMLHGLNRAPEHRNNCYEIYGFDVLLDSNLKPWLMEVNVCPSLSSSSPMDKKIKTTMMCDTMNLLGYLPYDKKKYEEERKNKVPGSEGRKYQPKNVNDVLNLNEENCLELLSSDDWNVLFETDEEYYRRGAYERIFPLKENVDIYSSYFENQRYNNLIVWRWLKCETNFLEKICKKVSQLAV